MPKVTLRAKGRARTFQAKPMGWSTRSRSNTGWAAFMNAVPSSSGKEVKTAVTSLPAHQTTLPVILAHVWLVMTGPWHDLQSYETTA